MRDPQPAPGQCGEHLGIALAGDQRVEHGPSRDPQDIGGRARELDAGVLQQLLDALLVAVALLRQVDPQPGVVVPHADLRRRDERGAEHVPLVQLGQPDRIERVGLGPAGDLLDVAGVDQPGRQPAPCKQVHGGAPVVGGGLHHDPLDALAGQLVGQGGDRVGGRRHVPDRGAAPARARGVGHPGAHLAGGLGDVDRGDALHDFLLGRGVALFPVADHATSSSRLDGSNERAARRPRSGNRNSDRRARSNRARPFRSGPGARLTHGLDDQGSAGVAGNPVPIFTPAPASGQGYGD